MDILKNYLEEAVDNAGQRKIAILGFQSAGAVTYCALAALGTEVECFLDIDEKRIGGTYFGKQVLGLKDEIEKNKEEYFIIDVSNYTYIMKDISKKYELIENVDYSSMHGLFKYDICDIVDPLLSFNRTEEITGFRRHGSLEAGAEKIYKIVALGGSTTDPSYSGLKSWTHYLHEELCKRNIANVVYNGGIVGYMSAQERDKFLRDVLPLQPDIVVSLSGDNDIGWNHCRRDNSYYSAYLLEQLVEPLYSLNLEPGESIEYGLHEERADYENWFRNQQIISAVAEEFDIEFCCFLQPSILSENYRMSAFEQNWMDLLNVMWKNEHKSVAGLFDNYKDFYNGARALMKKEHNYYDFTNAFDTLSGVYIDGIHCCEEGNAALAKGIADVIEAIVNK